MIEFVTVENMNRFSENALAAQHRLRYRSIIERQDGMSELPRNGIDQLTSRPQKCLVYRDERSCSARGLALLSDNISVHAGATVPAFRHRQRYSKKSPRLGRFALLHRPDSAARTRKRIAQEIVIGYLETGLRYGIEGIVGLMYPAYGAAFLRARAGKSNIWGKQLFSTTGTRRGPHGYRSPTRSWQKSAALRVYTKRL